MDRVKAWCIIIVNDKRQDTLVDDKLCDKERGQQYVQKKALPMIIMLYMIWLSKNMNACIRVQSREVFRGNNLSHKMINGKRVL